MTTERPWWKEHVAQIAIGLFVTIIGGISVFFLTKLDAEAATIGPEIEFIYEKSEEDKYEFAYKCNVDPCDKLVKSEKFFTRYTLHNASGDAGIFSIFIPVTDRSNYVNSIIDESEKIKIKNFNNSPDFVSKYGYIRLDIHSIDERAKLVVSIEGAQTSPVLGKPYADVDTIKFFMPWEVGCDFEYIR